MKKTEQKIGNERKIRHSVQNPDLKGRNKSCTHHPKYMAGTKDGRTPLKWVGYFNPDEKITIQKKM